MKVVLAGGGTGGHVYPALALGDELRSRGHEVVYAGAAERLEGRVAPERGYEFHAVSAPQFPRSGLVAKARFAGALAGAILRSRRLLKQLEPDLVLGVGGYIMAPTVLAAWSPGIRRAIHEANVSPGLANRLCARVADLVLLTYDATRSRLPTPAEVHTVGCPVNPKVLQGDRSEARARYGLEPDAPVVLVVGGSLGADRTKRGGRDDRPGAQKAVVTLVLALLSKKTCGSGSPSPSPRTSRSAAKATATEPIWWKKFG